MIEIEYKSYSTKLTDTYLSAIRNELIKKYMTTGIEPNTILLSKHIVDTIQSANKHIFEGCDTPKGKLCKIMGLDIIVVDEDYRIECITRVKIDDVK